MNTKLGILVYYDKMQLQDKRHIFESYSLGVMPLSTSFKKNDGS